MWVTLRGMLARLRLQDEEKQSSNAEDGNERCLLGPRHVGNVLCKVHITDSKSEHYALERYNTMFCSLEVQDIIYMKLMRPDIGAQGLNPAFSKSCVSATSTQTMRYVCK